MKIIDEKGRLLGKINIVDFSIILLFLIIIPAFFYIYDVLGKKPTRVPHTWVKVEVVTFIIPEIAELFKPGDLSYDAFGDPDGRLLKILKKDHTYSNKIKAAMPNRYRHRMPVFLEMELWCDRSVKANRWYYRRKPLTVNLEGVGFDFEAGKYDVRCFAIKIKD
ncbi:MAG: DUF4330 family protein [Candidatus Omnitrophota bacterium]|nr:MAG: DUF4330 family protein [Candidatus Omnitrophota bacterium]